MICTLVQNDQGILFLVFTDQRVHVSQLKDMIGAHWGYLPQSLRLIREDITHLPVPNGTVFASDC